MGQTMIEKIFQRHLIEPADVRPGEIVWIGIDNRSARDFGGANVVKNLGRFYPGGHVNDPAKTFFTFDCNAQNNDIKYAENQQTCRDFARNEGMAVHDVDAGIGSHVVIEQGLALPGTTTVGTDSHLNVVGAFGAFGQGMGDQDIAFIFKTGKTWFEVPHTIRIVLTGTLPKHVTPKDLTLWVVRKLTSKGALGRVVEFAGPVAESLSLSGKITLSSMATEMGAIAAFLPQNEETLGFLRARTGGSDVPTLEADADARYVKTLEWDVSNLVPQVACPPSPDNVKDVTELSGVEVNSIFIGSCTNGRFEDFQVAADIVRGKKVKRGVIAKMTPATREVWAKLLETGIMADLYAAGFVIGNAGCGGCAAGQMGMTGKGEVQLSTTNRNFPGKQGPGLIYLASPAVAAASALEGRIVAP